jgi:ubiquinone/menaquinone biosynthesis C-methylase UbiE
VKAADLSPNESREPLRNLGAGKGPSGNADTPTARQRAYYAHTAERYETAHVQDGDEHHVALRHIAFYLKWIDAQSVLDTGCGTGRALRFLREQLPHAYIKGNDPSEELLRIAVRDHGVPADALDCCPSEQLPYRDSSFDAVVATGVLHHVPEPQKVIDEMIRVARSAVFISDCNVYGQSGRVKGFAKRLLASAHLLKPLNWIRRGGHLWYWSPGDGIAYSYSVYDSIPQLRSSCRWIIVTPTQPTGMTGGSPLSESSHCLVSAFKTALIPQPPLTDRRGGAGWSTGPAN